MNAVCPAVIDTDMFRRAYEADPKKGEFANAMHPVGRIGKVEEIASAVLYLCSDGAAFTTGHSLAVDGGYGVLMRRGFLGAYPLPQQTDMHTNPPFCSSVKGSAMCFKRLEP